jgi:hypothetical protein
LALGPLVPDSKLAPVKMNIPISKTANLPNSAVRLAACHRAPVSNPELLVLNGPFVWFGVATALVCFLQETY